LEKPEGSDILRVDAGGQRRKNLGPLGWDGELTIAARLIHGIQRQGSSSPWNGTLCRA
jgi:hypothetical protein